MAKNGIYTRDCVSRRGKYYKAEAEYYRRKDSQTYKEVLEFKGDLKPSDVWDLVKRQTKPGEALIGLEILEEKTLVFEMEKNKFFELADCREVES